MQAPVAACTSMRRTLHVAALPVVCACHLVWPMQHDLPALLSSLLPLLSVSRLEVEAVDLYLVHSPMATFNSIKASPGAAVCFKHMFYSVLLGCGSGAPCTWRAQHGGPPLLCAPACWQAARPRGCLTVARRYTHARCCRTLQTLANALGDAVESGLTKHVGVSNYSGARRLLCWVRSEAGGA